jgi:hypothetical protein
MNIRILRKLSAFAVIGVLTCGNVSAQDRSDKKDAAKGATPDMAEMMKKWEAAATPGPEHKALEPLVGEWSLQTKFWMAGPDAPPTESKGTSKTRWILGNRFVQEEVDSEMNGMPFQGVGITGYDNMKKKYVGAWVDNMGTMLSTTEGTVDADHKVITSTGKMDDPMTGQKDKTVKYILRIISKDKHILEMYDLSLGEGDKGKMGEIVYSRKA